MVDFAKWGRRLDALTVQGLDSRYDVDAPGPKLYTLPHSWRMAAIEILSASVPAPIMYQMDRLTKTTSGEIDNLKKPEQGRTRVQQDKSKSSNKKKRGDEDLDDMRAAFARHQERAKGGGAGKNDWDKIGDGKNLRRILPRPGERKFYAEGWTHFNVGPNERALRCVDEEHIDPERGLPTTGTRCPLCKKFLREQSRINSEYAKGDEEGRAEWKAAKDKYTPRHQFYSNVLREDDEGDFEVKILSYGPQIWGQLMNYYLGDDTDVGDFTAVESDKWMNIKKESKGGRNRRNVEYKVFPVDGVKISKSWDAVKAALHDLDAAAGKVMSVDEVVAIMKGVDPDKDSDDDDASDDKSSGSRKKRSRNEDDEDDDSSGEDDDDDKPVKTSKSKLAAKMKKRRDDD